MGLTQGLSPLPLLRIKKKAPVIPSGKPGPVNFGRRYEQQPGDESEHSALLPTGVPPSVGAVAEVTIRQA